MAVLGLAGYVLLLATVAVRGTNAALAGAFLALTGTAFSGYLLWAQLERIHAICIWCVGNDVAMTCSPFCAPRASSASPPRPDRHKAVGGGAKMTQRGWLLFAAMCVIWGIPYLMIRVAVRELTPATLVFARTALGALLLVPAAAGGTSCGRCCASGGRSSSTR